MLLENWKLLSQRPSDERPNRQRLALWAIQVRTTHRRPLAWSEEAQVDAHLQATCVLLHLQLQVGLQDRQG